MNVNTHIVSVKSHTADCAGQLLGVFENAERMVRNACAHAHGDSDAATRVRPPLLAVLPLRSVTRGIRGSPRHA